MRFSRIKVHAMGPFKGTVDVDLAGIEGQLIAICGANGAGKTTLLELLAGALYRECPTRGTLAELATARDAYVEVQAVNGQAFTVRQHIDAISKKGETVVLDADGETPLLKETKVSHFDKWAAENIVPSSVLYSSSFAVQGRRGFLDLKPGERKELLVEVLGIRRLDSMAESARESAREAKALLETLRARLSDLGAPDIVQLAHAVDAAVANVAQTAEATRGARVALERARAAAGDAARQAELAEQRRAAEKRLSSSKAQLAEIEERLRNNRALLGRGDEVRRAVARATVIDREVEALRDAARVAAQTLVAIKTAESEARAAHQRALDAVGQAQSRVTKLLVRLKDRDAVSAAVDQLDLLKAQRTECETSIEVLDELIADNQALLVSGKDQRIAALRVGLGRLCDVVGDFNTQVARDTLSQDDDSAESQADAPNRIASARSSLDAKRRELTGVLQALSAAERLAARAGEMAQADADLAHARADEAEATAQLSRADAARDAAAAERTTASRAAEAAEDAVTDKRSERVALESLLTLSTRLERAEARIEELTTGLRAAHTALADSEAELATLPVVDVTHAVDVAAYEKALKQAELVQRTAVDAQSRANVAHERAQETIKAREAIEQQIAAAEDNLSDWTRLAHDLGKDGLQAMEIDAALPEWTEIANSLLHSCLGPRFTVELRTDRLSSDGKKVLEDLEARVLDTVNGRDADATTYSGGELVLVGSALSLGLTTLACRRAGVVRPTICLDEAGAALDAENGRAWIAMLRMAARQMDADKVLYISHSPEAQQFADARVVIENGNVTVS